MSFLEELDKEVELGRTTGRQMVQTAKEGTAEFTALQTEAEALGKDKVVIVSKIPASALQYRLVVVNQIISLGKTKASTKAKTMGKIWDRYQIVGRDTVTNQNLYTWIIQDEGTPAKQAGTLMEFPSFQLKEGQIAYDKGTNSRTFTKAIVDCFQSAGQGQAEELNLARQTGYAAAAANAIVAEKAAFATI